MTLDYILRLSDSAFTGPLQRARNEQGRFLSQGQNIRGVDANVGKLGGSFAKLTPLIAAAGLALVTAAGAGVAFAVKTAAAAEQTLIQFETLTGSMEQAKQTVQELQQMGAATPFELPQLTEAAKKLLAARVPTTALKSELLALGNVSAATGADIGNLATIYGQMAGKGKIYAEDMQQFVEAGAGEMKAALAESLGVSTSALNDLMSEGRVGFSDMQKALQSLAGAQGKWADSMEKQSKTTIGLWSTLKDNVTGVFRAIGQPINDGPVKTWLGNIVAATGTAGTAITNAIKQGRVGELLANSLTLGAKMGMNAVISFLETLPQRAKAVFIKVGQALKAALTGAWDMAAEILDSFDPSKMRFDTSKEEAFFKSLTAAAQENSRALEQNVQWAKTLDAVQQKSKDTAASSATATKTDDAKSDGRIRSKRDGSTVAKSSAQNTPTLAAVSPWEKMRSGMSNFQRLNARWMTGPNEGKYVNPAFSGRGNGPPAGGRMMGGGLAALHSANPGLPTGREPGRGVSPPGGANDGQKIFVPGTPKTFNSPGATKIEEGKAAAAQATAQRIQNAGGGDRPRWDLVEQIAQNTAKLQVL